MKTLRPTSGTGNAGGTFRRLLTHPLLPFGLLLLLLLAAHLTWPLIDGDEVYYGAVIGQRSLYGFLRQHYYTWSSRTLIELALCVIATLPKWVWRLLDPLVATGAAWCLACLVGGKKRAGVGWLVCAGFLIYNWSLMATAGWIATTAVYVWPAAAALFALLPAAHILRGEAPKTWQCILACVLTLYAANMEQVMIFLLPAFTGLMAYAQFTRKRVHPVLWVQLALCVLNLVWFTASPGVNARFEAESTSWYIDFAARGFFDNAELGLSAALNTLVYGRDYLFDLLCLCLAVGVWVKNREAWRRVLGALPLAISLVFGYAMRLFPSLAFFTEAIGRGGMVSVANGRFFTAYLPPALALAVFGLCLVNLYLALGHRGQSIVAIGALCLGLASRVAIGFSPTVWNSGERTAFFLHLAILGVACYVWRGIYRQKTPVKWLVPAYAAPLALWQAVQMFGY